MLALLTGSLSLALVGLGFWALQLQGQNNSSFRDIPWDGREPPRPEVNTDQAEMPEAPPRPSEIERRPDEDLSVGVGQVERQLTLVSVVESLFDALNRQDFREAEQQLTGQALEQFDQGLFEPFERIEVSELQRMGSKGSLVTLQGLVTSLSQEGITRRELWAFTLEAGSNQSLITEIATGDVISEQIQE